MYSPSALSLAALLAVALAARAATPVAQGADAAEELETKCEKKEDAIRVTAEGSKTILSVTSKSGIGGATIERKGERWPQELVLRLYVSGLESFAISCGDLRLTASVLSHDGSVKRRQLWKGDNEEPTLERASPYWMDILALDAAGKPVKGLPPNGGWFEMRIPKALLGAQAKALTLGWIDFYRR